MKDEIESLAWKGGGSYRNLRVHTGLYAYGGHRQVMLVDQHDEHRVISLVSINLAEMGLEPTPGAFWIKNYSEHKGLGEALVKAGVVERTPRPTVKYGPFDASADEYRLTPEYSADERLTPEREDGS